MRAVQKGASRLLLQLRGKAITGRANSSFPADARLKRRKDFLRVRECGKKSHSRHFLVVYAQSERITGDPDTGGDPGTAVSRLGIAVTKKSEASSVKRNRMKRLIREVFRLNRYRVKRGFDIVVIARGEFNALKFADVEREILDNMARGRLLNEPA